MVFDLNFACESWRHTERGWEMRVWILDDFSVGKRRILAGEQIHGNDWLIQR